VLYEMLTGDPPFTGSTAQAIVARVVTETPRPLLPQRHTIPPHVEAAVLTALEKLPADRFASAAEFADALKGRSVSGVSTATTARVPAAAAPAGRRINGLTIAALGLAAVATAAALWAWLRPQPVPVVNRYSLLLRPTEALRPSAIAGNVAISPDGNRIAYIGPAEGGTRLWLREHDKLRPIPIAGTEGALSPFFSPDGNQLAFIVTGRSLRVAPLGGGPPITLADTLNSSGGDWGTDGYIYIETNEGLGRIRAAGGQLETLFRLSEARHEIGAEYPNVMPDGKGIVFRRRLAGQSANDFDIMAMTIPGGTPRPLLKGIYAHYAKSGHLLVVSGDGKLLAVPFDPKKMVLTGPPVAVLDGMLRSGPFELNMAVSDNGTLVYTSGGSAATNAIWWVNRDGSSTPVDTGWHVQGTISSVALSPDAKSLAVTVLRGTAQDIWVKQIPTGPFSRVTFGDTAHFRGAWTGDGRSVVYISDQGAGAGQPSQRRADGTGTPQRLLQAAMSFGQAVPTRDGRWLVLRRSTAEQGAGDLYAVKTGDTTLVPLVTTPAVELSPAVSPDGRWLAYSSDESGTAEVYVRPFPDAATARWQVSSSGGTNPVWSRDSRELFYTSGHGEMASVPIKPGPTFNPGEPRPLFPVGPFTVNGNAGVFDVSPDGKRFLMIRPVAGLGETELVVVQNWFQELKQRGK
jgi:serine/threonine-protein kinase